MPIVHLKDTIASLPVRLAERCHMPDLDAPKFENDSVIYWMHSAMRLHENPAYDVARAMAHHLDKPLWVLQSYDCQHPDASDRHATFILQGACDVARQAEEENIYYAFHWNDNDTKALEDTLAAAALVITEDTPVTHILHSIKAIKSKMHLPMIFVDAQCILPMRFSNTYIEHINDYREYTVSLRKKQFGRPWLTPDLPGIDQEEEEFEPEPYIPKQLPFKPLNLMRADFAGLIAASRFDHTIMPIQQRQGGSKAGYRLWRRLRSHILSDYAQAKKEDLYACYGSLSPYLACGMISPFRLVYDIQIEDTQDGWRLAEVLFMHREFAYHFCLHNTNYENSVVLPHWAQLELQRLSRQKRTIFKSWMDLCEGHTTDAEWNKIQAILREHGFIPDDLWGYWVARIFGWVENPSTALALARAMYHKYSIEQDEPVSSLRILETFGLFDSPRERVHRVYGTLAFNDNLKTQKEAMAILDMKMEPVQTNERKMKSVAVIGAGLAGLTCANMLRDNGFNVRIFEKADRVGGRLLTRTLENLYYDLGAPFFTAKDKGFILRARSWEKDGLVEPWPLRIYQDGDKSRLALDKSPYVAMPKMSDLAVYYSRDLSLRLDCPVTNLTYASGGWRLEGKKGEDLGFYDRVILAMPAPQAMRLLSQVDTLRKVFERIENVTFLPVWTAGVCFRKSLGIKYNAFATERGALAYAFQEDQKPKRFKDSRESWVFHAQTEWTEDNLDLPAADVIKEMAYGLSDFFRISLPAVVNATVYLWKHAYVEKPFGATHLYHKQVGICGDWLLGSRVEDAFLSGVSMAARLINEDISYTK